MLKTVSSIVNAIGALNYKGTWNASTNTPTLASGVGTKGDYYQVSVAGSTNLNGISNWGVGDVVAFNGVTWQRIEGGADLNGVNLSVSGTSTLSGLTASTALALNASKEVISVTNTGSGNNVLATSPQIATPTLTGDVQMSTGNLVVGTSGKGIDFSATTNSSGAMTSEVLSDYEEGTWTPVLSDGTNNATMGGPLAGHYTKIGNTVFLRAYIYTTSLGSVTGNLRITGLPFAVAAGTDKYSSAAIGFGDSLALTAGQSLGAIFWPGASYARLQVWDATTGSTIMQATEWTADGEIMIQAQYQA
jgi:hypothetical protein